MDLIISLSLNGLTNCSHPPYRFRFPDSSLINFGLLFPLQTNRTTQEQLTTSVTAQLASLPNEQQRLSPLPPPHRVSSAPPALTNVALVNQLPSALVFIAATMRHFLTGDAGARQTPAVPSAAAAGMERQQRGQAAPGASAPGQSIWAKISTERLKTPHGRLGNLANK